LFVLQFLQLQLLGLHLRERLSQVIMFLILSLAMKKKMRSSKLSLRTTVIAIRIVENIEY